MGRETQDVKELSLLHHASCPTSSLFARVGEEVGVRSNLLKAAHQLRQKKELVLVAELVLDLESVLVLPAESAALCEAVDSAKPPA